jgi:hypothetical protein
MNTFQLLEPKSGFEPPTYSLQMSCSTAELLRREEARFTTDFLIIIEIQITIMKMTRNRVAKSRFEQPPQRVLTIPELLPIWITPLGYVYLSNLTMKGDGR